MISPEYIVSFGESCLQFFHHMWSLSTYNALTVYLKADTEIQGDPLWTLSGDECDL